MPEQDFIYFPLDEQIILKESNPKPLLRFPTFESVLNFPNTICKKPAQQFTCPNCDEITTGFPCEQCGYDDEVDYDPYKGE